jgi:hypothetical protein
MTTYLLDGLRELLVHHIDPSTLNDDVLLGLKEKERLLSLMTEEMLRTEMDDYDEVENELAAGIKSDFTNFLLSGDPSYIPVISMPSLSINLPQYNSSSSGFEGTTLRPLAGQTYQFQAVISGGNLGADNFNYEVIVTTNATTEDTQVTLVRDITHTPDYREILIDLIFPTIGLFNIEFRATHIEDSEVQLISRFSSFVTEE